MELCTNGTTSMHTFMSYFCPSGMEVFMRTDWFTEARFGMFIHWGLYAIPARDEWIKSIERIPNEVYDTYFDEFNPKDFYPKKWAALAKRAGMKYAVLTAKHHDGFCLFDSELTEYKSTNTKCKRDLVREYIDAFRAEGLRVGLYYSLLDWHHPDYPHYKDQNHPMRDNIDFKDMVHNFDVYLDYMHGQVKELCSNYGKLDILWFDFSYGEMKGEKWRATELIKMVRGLQPDVIIDNRLEASGEGFGSLMTDNPTVYSGDFVSPEQIIPPDGIRKENGNPVCWEACFTLNNHWGYAQFDNEYKSPATIVRKLVECVSKGGNVLLNVGPNAKGVIPKASTEILEQVGRWMDENSESIYGCGYGELPKPDYGYITRNGKYIYIHVLEGSIGPLPVRGIKKDDIKRIRLLSSDSELRTCQDWVASNYPALVFIGLHDNGYGTHALPDEIDTVVMIELKG